MKKLYCGIDLHARILQICIIDAQLKKVLERKLPCDLALLLELLKPFKKRVSIAIESTFNWYWLVDGLQDAGYEVHLAHALGLSRITKAKVKTDRRDAFTLAKYLLNGDLPEAYIYPKESRPIRDLVRQRQRLVDMRSREYAALRLRLYQHGFLTHSRNGCKTSDPEDFSSVFADCRLSVLLTQERERIQLLSSQIDDLEDKILDAAGRDPSYLRLTQIPGFGKALSAIVFYETGDARRFRSPRHYASYCRLVPGAAESAGHSKRGRSPKEGNHRLKCAYTQAAVHAARCYPKIRSLYDRTAAKHPGRGSKLIAMNVVAHKLSTAAFKMLTEGTDYNETLIFGN